MKPIKTLLLTMMLVGTATVAYCQDPPPGDPDNVPIDGGVSVLVASAVAYGIKKVHQSKNKVKNDNHS